MKQKQDKPLLIDIKHEAIVKNESSTKLTLEAVFIMAITGITIVAIMATVVYGALSSGRASIPVSSFTQEQYDRIIEENRIMREQLDKNTEPSEFAYNPDINDAPKYDNTTIKWIEITERQSTLAGVCFYLPDFVAGIREVLTAEWRNADEGYYQFHFTAQSVNPTQTVSYKIVSQGGLIDGHRPTLQYRRFSSCEPSFGLTTRMTYWLTSEGSDSRDYGRIPAFSLNEMALHEQELALISDDENSFIVKRVIVEHFLTDEPDEIGFVIYDMLVDPLIQNLASGQPFMSGSMGFGPSIDTDDTNFVLINNGGS
jgi:hypothetical protein